MLELMSNEQLINWDWFMDEYYSLTMDGVGVNNEIEESEDD